MIPWTFRNRFKISGHSWKLWADFSSPLFLNWKLQQQVERIFVTYVIIDALRWHLSRSGFQKHSSQAPGPPALAQGQGRGCRPWVHTRLPKAPGSGLWGGSRVWNCPFFTVLIFVKKCFKNFISSQHNINLKGKSLISGMLEIHMFICDCFL